MLDMNILLLFTIVIHCITIGLSDVLPDGRGKSPLLGWRSWNLYGADVDQDLMESSKYLIVLFNSKIIIITLSNESFS